MTAEACIRLVNNEGRDSTRPHFRCCLVVLRARQVAPLRLLSLRF